LFDRILGYSLTIESFRLFGDCLIPSISTKELLFPYVTTGCLPNVSYDYFCNLHISFFFKFYWLLKLLGVLPLDPSSSKWGIFGERAFSKSLSDFIGVAESGSWTIYWASAGITGFD